MEGREPRLAVLIDADNAPRSALPEIMAEAAVYGDLTVKRIYGDWSTPNLGSWKNLLLEHAIVPVQQYAYTTGKNSTDSAMIIDAMDILYTVQCDGFVIVSSDSDFTRLAIRLREAGKKVYGIGEKKTPSSFRMACDKFIYVESIRAEAPAPVQTEPADELPPCPAPCDAIPREVALLIAEALDTVDDEDGYAFLGKVGNLLNKKQPDFDPRNYGYRKLSDLVRALPEHFEVTTRTVGGNPHIFIRNKRK